MSQTLRQWVYTTLRDDDVPVIGLRALLGKAATPWGVYRQWPPKTPVFPLVTYAVVAEQQRGIRLPDGDIYFNLTAWGSNYIAVRNRVYELLHNQRPAASDYKAMLVYFDQMIMEGFDEDFNTEMRQDRYAVRVVRR